jgi:hypothetical protein
MNSHLRPLLTAALLLLASVSTGVFATPLVVAPTYTPNQGLAGGPTVFKPTLRISDDPNDSIDFQSVYIWEFRLDWDETALTFDPYSVYTTISFGESGHAHAYSGPLSGVANHLAAIGSPVTAMDNLSSAANVGSYILSWESDLSTNLNLGTEINFQGSYTIREGAAPDDYLFSFIANATWSSIMDSDLEEFKYDDVTQQDAPMMITVKAPTPAPEPGMAWLLLGGLGALAVARQRRRSSH